jgi:ankyrin repeat protein
MKPDGFADPIERDLLHLAAQSGDVSRVIGLLESGSDPNAFDDLGKTPLSYAAEEENIEVMTILLKSGADPNLHCEEKVGNTALGEVAGSCSYEVAKLLVNAGADPTIPGWMQLTALHRAKERKRGDGPKVFQLLLDAAKKR